jgi:hypothetical protein
VNGVVRKRTRSILNCLFFSIIVGHLRGPRLVHGLLVTFIEEENTCYEQPASGSAARVAHGSAQSRLCRSHDFTLALGIATSATVFGWVDAILLHPLPGVADPDRLVALETLTPEGAFATNSYPDYIDFRDRLKLVSGVAVTLPAAFSVGQEDHAERVWGELVSGNFFSVLSAKAELGRTFLPEEFGDKPEPFLWP